MRAALPLLLLLLAGCVAQTAPAHRLAGSEWRFVSIDGEAPASDKTHLSFEREHVAANVGCNSMTGPWRVQDGRLVAGPLAQTKMFCDGAVWDHEQAANALLVAAPEISLENGRLVLRSSGHFAELERIVPAPAE